MKKITKSKKLENVNYAIRGKVLEEAERMEKAGFEIIKLNIGNPAVFNFKAPKKIVESMKDGIENSHGYSNSKGLESARTAIIEYYEGKKNFLRAHTCFNRLDLPNFPNKETLSEAIKFALENEVLGFGIE